MEPFLAFDEPFAVSCVLQPKLNVLGYFIIVTKAIILHTILEALGNPQPPTRIKTVNSTANSFVKNNIRQCQSKTWDMWWNWLRDDLTKK